ncbi:MAG: hypothetical protein L6Q99_13955 [Planctomycetes bacterium]|nr:hypothetical protein [Planctomycetota bacterium]
MSKSWFVSRRIVRRLAGTVLLLAGTVQCASPRDSVAGVGLAETRPVASGDQAADVAELRYRGLTLDEWCRALRPHWTVDASASTQAAGDGGGLRTVQGPVRQAYETGIGPLVEAATHFAPHDARAVALLERVTRDLDERLAERAIGELVELVREEQSTRDVAARALATGLGSREPRIAHLFLAEMADAYESQSAEMEHGTGADRFGAEVFSAYVTACSRAIEVDFPRSDLDEPLAALAIVQARAPERVRVVAAYLSTRPLPFDGAAAAGALRSFAWNEVDVDRAVETKDWSLVVAAARAASECAPQDPLAWNVLAFACWRAGLREEGVKAIERAIAEGERQEYESQAQLVRNGKLLSKASNWTEEARKSERSYADLE